MIRAVTGWGRKVGYIVWLVLLVACRGEEGGRELELSADTYYNKLHGAWQATMVANHSGLDLQGIYIDEAGTGQIDLVLLDEWSTDDDTHVEWVDLHILETHGLYPTYEQIRDEWVEHLNNDIWVSALRARQLMDEGIVPPQTSDPDLNPEGVWSIGAQLQTELFGMVAPGMPNIARERARYFARVSNSGLAVEASAFYADLYARAFFESDIPTLIEQAKQTFPTTSEIYAITESVQEWHKENPNDWPTTRQRIRDAYDTDPNWWASKVNFAATIMALLYGEGDLLETLNIAGLAGWDADNNMTSAAGLLGIIIGFDNLPDPIRTSTDIYFNQDVTGDLPQYDTVTNIAQRTQRIGEQFIFQNGGRLQNKRYELP